MKCVLLDSMQARNRGELSKHVQPLVRRRRSNRIRSTREKNDELSKELLTALPYVGFRRRASSARRRHCNKSKLITVNKPAIADTFLPNIPAHYNVSPEPQIHSDKRPEPLCKLKPITVGINDNFCEDLLNQFTLPRFKVAHKRILSNIFEEITDINSVIVDGMEPKPRPSAIKPQAIPPPDDEAIPSSPVVLVPKSKWIFSTPVKQRIRSMDELNFGAPENALEPAVLQKNKKVKTVFEVDQNLQQHIDLTTFEGAREVPIDLKYLKPVCSVLLSDEENSALMQPPDLEENQFLMARTEETIDLNAQVFNFGSSSGFNQGTKRRHVDDKDDDQLSWYEKQMKVMATCRPSKTVEKIDRCSFLQRKSLSFQEETTPKSHLCENKRYKSLDNNTSTNTAQRDDFDTDFALLESEFYQEDGLNVSQTSQQLSSLFDNVAINRPNEIPAFKFFRRQHDP